MFATNGLDSFLTCDNSMDANGAEHDSLGRFTGKQKKDLLNSPEDVNIKLSKAKRYPELTGRLRELGLASSNDEAMEPVRIKILDPGAHGSRQLAKRGITLADAQSYVDDAFIMIKQSQDKYLFIANDGSAAVIVNGRLSTAFPASWHDDDQLRKIEVIKKWLTTKT